MYVPGVSKAQKKTIKEARHRNVVVFVVVVVVVVVVVATAVVVIVVIVVFTLITTYFVRVYSCSSRRPRLRSC